MGSTTVIVGLQWGDEGKGKITDYLAKDFDVIARYNGGSNAGHTVVLQNEEFRLQHIPSGIFHKDTICVLGNGTVIDLKIFLHEMRGLIGSEMSLGKIYLSDCAHIIMPYHVTIELAEEERRKGDKLGTTGRGIGPTYADKANRYGIRLGEFINESVFNRRLASVLEVKNIVLTEIYKYPPLSFESIVNQYKIYREELLKYATITDTVALLHKFIREGKRILLEGAQGTMLDLDLGSYPFVTSSNATAGGACTGTGIGPRDIDKVIGITKAYTTRVGNGPFLTEFTDALVNTVRDRGHEFGTTTGRARRCGWIDMPILKRTVKLNTVDELVVTKLDVLSGLSVIKVCTDYSLDNEVIDFFPTEVNTYRKVKPVYCEFNGWDQDITKVRNYKDLPYAARVYLEFLEEELNVKLKLISVDSPREATIEVP